MPARDREMCCVVAERRRRASGSGYGIMPRAFGRNTRTPAASACRARICDFIVAVRQTDDRGGPCERDIDVRTLRRDFRRPDDAGAAGGLPGHDQRPRGRLPGPYKVWVHNPKLLRAAAPLGEHFTPASQRCRSAKREIAVVVITADGIRPTPRRRTNGAARKSACRRRRWKRSWPAFRLVSATSGSRWCTKVAMSLAGGRLVSHGLYGPGGEGARARGCHRRQIVLMGYYTASR